MPELFLTGAPRLATRGHDQHPVLPIVPLARSVVVGAAAFARAFGSGRFSLNELHLIHAAMVIFFCPNRVLNRIQKP